MRKSMRTIGILLSALFLLTACDSSDNHEMVIDDDVVYTSPKKVDVDYETQNQLSNFFLEELYHNYSDNSGQDYPGFFGKLEWDAQPCYLINSNEEFLSAYKGTKQLPEVDFERYSILVGRSYCADGSESIDKYNLIDEGDHYRMYIGILRNVNPNYTYPHVIRDLFYWDVYPKRESKPITIERRVVDKVVDFEHGADALQHHLWTLTNYISEDNKHHQAGNRYGDDRLTISFEKDGKVKVHTRNGSLEGSYQANATKANLTSGDGLQYFGNLLMYNIIKDTAKEKESSAIYYCNRIGSMDSFRVDSYYLVLSNSEGVTFYFRDASLK